MDDGVVRSDLVNDDPYDGPSYMDWYCEPPAEGVPYEVTREEDGGWRLGHPVRRILEVRITG